eukprot:scaffold120715_cov58-Attheya_sp.AAC.3
MGFMMCYDALFVYGVVLVLEERGEIWFCYHRSFTQSKVAPTGSDDSQSYLHTSRVEMFKSIIWSDMINECQVVVFFSLVEM